MDVSHKPFLASHPTNPEATILTVVVFRQIVMGHKMASPLFHTIRLLSLLRPYSPVECFAEYSNQSVILLA